MTAFLSDEVKNLVNESNKTIVKTILEVARDVVQKNNLGTKVHPAAQEAQYALETVRLIVETRGGLRVLLARVAIDVERQKMYLHYPATGEYPEGLGDLGEFLRAAGVKSRSAINETRYVAEDIAPYCDRIGVDIGDYLVNGRYRHLIEASTALKRAARDKDAAEFKNILNDVKLLPTSDDVRAKYRQQRRAAGQGGRTYLDDDQVVLVLVLEDNDAASAVTRKLGGTVSWDLIGAATERENSLQVTVSGMKKS